MADFEQKNNQGVLFKNKNKKEDKHPEYNGTCIIDGIKKDISVWVKKSKEGTMYMSLAFKEPYIKGESKPKETEWKSDIIEEKKGDKLPF